MKQPVINIALTEDNPVNRNTFVQKINQLPGYKVLFMARNGNECLEELKGMQVLPSIIFMDIEMPELDGIQTIALAKSFYPGIHFIVLTVFDDDEKIFEAIKAGASGYLLKHESASFLQESIVNVLEYGGAPMSPAIARKSLQLLSKMPGMDPKIPGTAVPSIITDREKQVLQFMINGWDAKRISSELDLSVLTVRKHIANIYEKLHVSSRAEVITMAHHNRWFNS